YETYYRSALENSGYVIQHWDVALSGQPTPSFFPNYEALIWFSGDEAQNTLTTEDQASLSSYLDQGGRLFITGQNIGADIGQSDFYSNYLHAEFILDDWTGPRLLAGVSGDPISDGLLVAAYGSDGADNQTSPDVIEPLDEAVKILTYYQATEGGAIRYENENYKLVYFAFGFE
ncbi:MAG: hypothetical protein GY869_00575, partial [Planctomycetes bacterium]|nr:hypothetical protein [Planctomycetota bacterium]